MGVRLKNTVGRKRGARRKGFCYRLEKNIIKRWQKNLPFRALPDMGAKKAQKSQGASH